MATSKERLERIRLKAETVGMVFAPGGDGRTNYRFGRPGPDGESGYFGMLERRTFRSLREAEAYAEGLFDGWTADGDGGDRPAAAGR